MVLIVLYVVVFLAIGMYTMLKEKGFDDFVIAGRKESEAFILMSLLATMIGASASIGVADLSYSVGFPAFFWLGFGGAALILQSLFLSKRVRSLNCYTLPDLTDKVMGREGKIITAFIIVVSWIGIVSAQIIAASGLIAFITGFDNSILLIVITSLFIIVYTSFGGQKSVIKTDFIQFVIVALGIVYVFVYLFFFKGSTDVFSKLKFEVLNDKFGVVDLLYFVFIVGGVYMVGPDIFTRNFASKDENTAKRATFKAGIILMIFSLIIVLIGMWTKVNTDMLSSGGVIYTIISRFLTPVGGIILAFALLSAVVSSADTCIMTSASIIEKDILKKESINGTRVFIVIIGVISCIIALFKRDIISLLLYAYSVYTSGVVFPLFFAILFHNKKRLNRYMLLSGIIIGGVFGILSSVLANRLLALIGLGLSLVFSLLSLFFVNDKKKSELL